MTTYKKNKRLAKPRGFGAILFALILVIGAIFFTGTAYAADNSPPGTLLVVKEVWLTGDTLHVSVADGGDPSRAGGEVQTLELNLSDYAKPGDEYVTIQATDNSGRESNTITFKNPYYQQPATTEPPAQNDNTPEAPSESAVLGNPFTPDGTGTVVDNVTEQNGKEFFTVETPDGNVFYLIVDRQRDSENVYLLNAVNENDLASLAKPGDGKNVSAVPTPETQPGPAPQTSTEPTPTPEPAPEKNGNDNNMLIFIAIAVVVIGGAAYYFKIVRPKQGSASVSDYDEPDDDFDDDKEYDRDSDDEDEDGDDE